MDFEPEGKKYSLGLRVFQLGLYVSNSLGYAGTATPVLTRLTEKTQEASILAVQDEDRFLTVAKVDGPKAFRVTSDPGYRGYLHCSAVGKALVAFAEPGESAKLVDTLELVPVAPKSITDRDEFRAEIERIRTLGYALMDEENEVGMRAVAVPVLDHDGRAIAAGSAVVGKWLLVGRIRTSEHPLWSSFVWRNEVVDAFVEMVAAPWFARAAAGTPALVWWLRLLGARIGRGAWCESYWLPEADLVALGPGSTVNRGCVIQTHLFHDRIMSIDAVNLGQGATIGPHGVILPGASIDSGATVGPASLVMRGEGIPAGTYWRGNPVAPWREPEVPTR
ncbi:IclR family transcriptional regulator C-terminal domain-containing protein [Sinomonas sp. G460-2]|uniref:IclR family transcriptional regulator domain-containing protein n=1 Tax=Sinomonas sp. G460-2 TaxID=3393464 RepID=UPI0039F063E9